MTFEKPRLVVDPFEYFENVELIFDRGQSCFLVHRDNGDGSITTRIVPMKADESEEVLEAMRVKIRHDNNIPEDEDITLFSIDGTIDESTIFGTSIPDGLPITLDLGCTVAVK